jgi:hypothetical protein
MRRKHPRSPRPLLSRLVQLGLGASLTMGCNAYKIAPPPGFAEVDRDASSVRMKGPDDIGLALRVYDNVRGGTLAYWSEDLVRKLARRGYSLEAQAPIVSDNGVAGTRFDFSYHPPDAETPKFYTAMLFVSDKYKVIVQVAGDAEHHAHLARQIDRIAAETKIRGCRPGKRTCRGPQPGPLTSPRHAGTGAAAAFSADAAPAA